MTAAHWPTNQWPENVARDVDGYDIPLFSTLDEAARNYPEQVYTLFMDETRTFAQVKTAADQVANFLSSSGIQKGDRVAICLPNIPHFPIVFFGILKAGAICVSCNPLYTSPELHYQLNDAGAKAIFCMNHPRQYPVISEAAGNTSVRTVVVCGEMAAGTGSDTNSESMSPETGDAQGLAPGHHLFEHILAEYGPTPPDVRIDPPEDLALIFYTAGTTGMPKGAALTHSNISYDLKALDEWARLQHEPGGPQEQVRKGGFHTYMGVIPWYQSFGLTVCMLAACWSASRLVCLPDPRAGEPPFTETLKSIQKYKATIMPAVPTIFISLINHPLLDEFDLTSLMGCFSGGAPLPSEVCKQFEAKTGAIIFEGYGLSETAPVATSNPTIRSLRKIGTVGFPLPGTDVKILDMETAAHEMPLGADGEIAISGPQIMKGYWNQPETNETVFREIEGRRYFLTGDIGHIDEDGYILITDRKKDMIIVGGFNVYPKEIENTLFEHPKIEIAVVTGVPDSESGEAVKAHIQLKQGENATEEEIRKFCKERLTSYKCPKFIEFRETMPVSPGGKLLRRQIRDDTPWG